MYLGDQPIAHRFLAPDATGEERFPLNIDYCTACGLGQIVRPIPPEVLYRDYNFCFSTWKPEPHREDELRWIRSQLPGGRVFEVGCNDGLFLSELSSVGTWTVAGIEPNHHARAIAEGRGFPISGDFLGPDTARQAVARFGRFDLVVARQVLEHLGDIGLFFDSARELLSENGLLFVDVPDVEPGLLVGDCTIAWEEHVNYFTESVLRQALRRYGFEPLDFRKYDFSGGTLAVLARKVARPGTPPEPLPPSQSIVGFPERLGAYRKALVAALQRTRAAGVRVVIYGVGCRACALVNGLGLSGLVDFAIDDQKERQGLLMPGSRLRIRPPGEVSGEPIPTLVLLAVNRENEAKVEKRLRDAWTGRAEDLRFLRVFGPTTILDEVRALGG